MGLKGEPAHRLSLLKMKTNAETSERDWKLAGALELKKMLLPLHRLPTFAEIKKNYCVSIETELHGKHITFKKIENYFYSLKHILPLCPTFFLEQIFQ